jgi:hypothetical protein
LIYALVVGVLFFLWPTTVVKQDYFTSLISDNTVTYFDMLAAYLTFTTYKRLLIAFTPI